ncbi:MAG TPA: caspase family protein [Nostocaceae cyanobacterium]|nr:caspase family protein [Nostocaceae cyanobacterium]
MSRDALVVGINSYKHESLRNLTAPAKDAEEIAKLLEQYGDFKVKRLPGIRNKENNRIAVGQKTQVTLQQLEEAIVQLFKPEGRNVPDTALLFFSGHGLRKNIGIQQGFLATSDVDTSIGNWGLSLHWLRQLLTESEVRQQVIILDCCHSGELFNFNEANPEEKGKVRDRCFIAASREFEKAYQELGSTYSVLSSVLIKGLQPKQDRWITNHSLTDFLNQEPHSFPQRPICHNIGQIINLTRNFAADDRTLIAPPEQTICPYKGLSYFDCNDEDPKYFFGRTDLIDQLLQKIRSGNFLAILGASGSGKSSVVRAGLIHQLKLGRRLSNSKNWQILIFRPGDNPIDSLVKAFLDPNLSNIDRAAQLTTIKKMIADNPKEWLGNLITTAGTERVVIVVDQFEEVFTLCQNDKLRQMFFEYLLSALERPDNKLCLILTMRADFFGKCAEQDYAGLAKKIEDNLVMVTPMNRSELEQAITKPAEEVGLKVDIDLVSLMIEDMENSPGSLPLLQYTLTELWKLRNERQLTVSAYRKLGGVKETLQKRATQVYEELELEEQKAAKGIFLELTQLGEGTEDTRRRVLLRNLVTSQQSVVTVERVIQKLANANLVVTSTLLEKGAESASVAVVDIAHESLIRHWSLLRQWVKEHRDAIRIERRIEAAAQEWESQNKLEDYLLQGRKLNEAQSYLDDYSDLGLLSSLAREFIAASKAASDRLRLQQEERQRRELETAQKLVQESQARLNAEEEARQHAEKRAEEQAKAQEAAQKLAQTKLKQTRIITVGSLSVGLVLTILSLYAFDQKQNAFDQKQNAFDREIAALSSAAEARISSNQEFDDLDALTKALQAGKKLNQVNKENSELRAQVIKRLHKVVYGVKESNRFDGHQNVVKALSFSPDGTSIATGGWDGTIRLWDINGQQLAEHSLDDKQRVTSLSFSSKGNKLIVASHEGKVYLLELQDKKLNKPSEVKISHSGKQINSINFSPDGKKFVTGSDDGTAYLWDLQGKKLSEFKEPQQPDKSKQQPQNSKQQPDKVKQKVNSVTFSPNGNMLAIGYSGDNGKVVLWDIKDPNNKKLELVYDKHTGDVLSVSFSPKGNLLASVGKDRSIRVWTLKGTYYREFKVHQGVVRSVSFSPDGQRLATVGDDSTIRVWNLEDKFVYDQLIDEFKGHQGIVQSVSFSPTNGQQLATVGDDGTLRLWDLKDKQEADFKAHGKIWSVSFSPNGQYLATSGHDGTARLWDMNNKQKEPVVLKPEKKGVGVIWNVSFSPNGERLATAAGDNIARLWDLKGGMVEFIGHKGEVTSISFSPTEKKLATSSKDGTVRLWDFYGNQSRIIGPHKDDKYPEIMSVTFSPDGKLLATANGKANTARLWDLNGQPKAVMRGHEKASWVLSVKFHPNKKLLATSGDDGTARLWDFEGNELDRFKGHNVAVKSISFSPDGRQLATVSADRTAIVWDLQSKQQIAKFRAHQTEVESVSFSPNGELLATAGRDGTAKVWKVQSLDALIARGCSWIGNYLKYNPEVKDSDRHLCEGINTSHW